MSKKLKTSDGSAGLPPGKTTELFKAHGLNSAAKWLHFAVAYGDLLSIAGVFGFFLKTTWLRWPDPLIDFPKELYAAWRVSEGDLLYVKVINWYGPLPELVNAAGFRIFGVGLNTMIWLNVVLTIGIILLIRGIFGTLGNRLSFWLCSLVFVLVFAFGQYVVASNYNFMTPYVAQATYGFAGLLVLLWGLLRQLKSGRLAWCGVAGFGLAVVYLDKPEALLAAIGAGSIYFVAQVIQVARSSNLRPNSLETCWPAAGRWLVRAVGWVLGGFLCLWLPVFIFFLSKGGPAYAILAADYVPYTMLNSSYRDTGLNTPVLREFFGFDHPWTNFGLQLGAGLLFLLVTAVLAVASGRWARARRYSAQWWVFLLIVLAVAGVAATGVSGQPYQHWYEMGRALVFPVFLTSTILVVGSCWLAWRQRPEFAHVLGLAIVGVGASLMLARMILFGRLYQYGFFMMPLTAMFLVHLLVAELARPIPGSLRTNWLLPVAVAAVVLFGAGSLGLNSYQVETRKTYEVGTGRDHFYTYPPEVSLNGPLLNGMIQTFKQATPQAKTLVAFPEGIAVNYHLRVPSPLAEMEFNPIALGFAGVPHVLEELQASPPDVIFLHYRDLSEHGVKYFGETNASGKDILLWLQDNYRDIGAGGQTEYSSTGHLVDFFVPKAGPKENVATPASTPKSQ